jgi:hypothetical protein
MWTSCSNSGSKNWYEKEYRIRTCVKERFWQTDQAHVTFCPDHERKAQVWEQVNSPATSLKRKQQQHVSSLEFGLQSVEAEIQTGETKEAEGDQTLENWPNWNACWELLRKIEFRSNCLHRQYIWGISCVIPCITQAFQDLPMRMVLPWRYCHRNRTLEFAMDCLDE